MADDTRRGGGEPHKAILRFDGRRMCPVGHEPVEEHPVALTVNGRELVTLIASPHDLEFLVAGFLRMQGLVDRLDDIQALTVCPEFGAASARIRKEVPARLVPTITSGCGGGIGFDIPGPSAGAAAAGGGAAPGRRYSSDDVFSTMDQLERLATRYRAAGGIHSAAAGDGRRILLHAEDIGRHNTIDRIAGEALLKEIDLSGAILATSGRVSSEMAAKGAALGVGLIASRTSPTDMAAEICDDAGIALLGYVRGRRFNVYARAERLAVPAPCEPIQDVTGVILAGGSSTRMGSNKALLPYQGATFVESIHRRMAALFRDVILVTNAPEVYRFMPCPTVADVVPGFGALSGIHAALRHAGTGHVFVVACDMPSVSGDLVRCMVAMREGHDAVVPESGTGLEPLCAVYGKGALPAIEEALRSGCGKVVSVLPKIRVRTVARHEVSLVDPGFRSFRNINTPADYYALREGEAGTVDP
ncbi:MAG: formate dehydrogenase accessory sulfurtransferase FdhD [Gemmatimonadota bacterium]